MGAIIDARDTNLRRSVAMKVILDPSKAGKEEVMRFIMEAQITSQLEHPSIVPVYDLQVDSAGKVFYTMKFVKGITLKDVIRQIRDGNQETISKYPLTLFICSVAYRMKTAQPEERRSDEQDSQPSS